MSKKLIAAVVGGLIIFIWQFLSWALINIHVSQTSYTPNQDKVMQVLSENLKEGSYMLPSVAKGASAEEHEALMKSASGKPWAMVHYRDQYNMSQGMNMFRGVVVDIFAVFLLVMILVKIDGLDFMTCLTTCLSVGIIGYLTTFYTNSIWFETNSIPDLIDAIVQWGICGAWLGFFLGRN